MYATWTAQTCALGILTHAAINSKSSKPCVIRNHERSTLSRLPMCLATHSAKYSNSNNLDNEININRIKLRQFIHGWKNERFSFAVRRIFTYFEVCELSNCICDFSPLPIYSRM